jgi:hypothetical protein
MSHFTRIKTAFTDSENLKKALSDLGFCNVEHHESPQPLYGYQGDVRPEAAEIVIRREFVGKLSNDIGFRRGSDGTLAAIISEFDRTKYSQAWLKKLLQRYAYHATVQKLVEEQGFSLVEEEQQGTGAIHLVLRRAF